MLFQRVRHYQTLFHETKKIIEALGLKYVKIHACPNNCMLFWKEKASDDLCSVYGASRWKNSESASSSAIGISNMVKKKKF